MFHRLFTVSVSLLVSLAAGLAALKPEAAPTQLEDSAPLAAPVATPAGPVFIFPFKDEVSPASLAFLRRSLFTQLAR